MPITAARAVAAAARRRTSGRIADTSLLRFLQSCRSPLRQIVISSMHACISLTSISLLPLLPSLKPSETAASAGRRGEQKKERKKEGGWTTYVRVCQALSLLLLPVYLSNRGSLPRVPLYTIGSCVPDGAGKERTDEYLPWPCPLSAVTM